LQVALEITGESGGFPEDKDLITKSETGTIAPREKPGGNFAVKHGNFPKRRRSAGQKRIRPRSKEKKKKKTKHGGV